MASTVPVIQVLSRRNYEDQHMVSLPDALPLPALPPSSLRIKTSIISLTTNNLTYAKFGHLLGWWDIHLLPQSITVEYSDPQKFGRISGWGYGTVTDSTVPGVEVDTQLWGYLPIGTLPVDVEVQVDPKVSNQIVATSKHRQHVLPIYNRYLAYPPAKSAEEASKLQQSQAYDSLMQVLFETSYLTNRFVFPSNPAELVHPTGSPDDGWNLEKGDIGPKTTVVLFSPSGKTALSFAHQLKHARPASKQPHSIIGVGSSSSKPFSENTGLFDKVLAYEADSGDLTMELNLLPDSKLVILDFGARGNAPARWVAKLRPTYKEIVQIDLAGEVGPEPPEKVTEKFMAKRRGGDPSENAASFSTGSLVLNASGLRSQAMAILGEKRYFEEFLREWNGFKAQGGVKGLEFVWGSGMEDLKGGWEALCRGEVGPNMGLLYKL
ncbi:uncharacterized protein PAC_09571 [Phialocephala subalpina]|uniref:Uncharacterized protein n=1 Tax=Phialocephala subalpina TaxID=576137 RepID=A0A1L7X3W3_9HELO|nr:uncharacterized protein PAC_09571 [Phialocephala subalpina]